MNLMTQLEMSLRILAACIMGGVIGFERERHNKGAGFCTHMLVATAAALVCVTGEYIIINFGGTDPTRIAAQVVSGIGFLGAGTILKSRGQIVGLTTAASLWAVACIGIAAGSGFYVGALCGTIIIMIVLTVLKPLDAKIGRKGDLGEENEPIESESEQISGQEPEFLK